MRIKQSKIKNPMQLRQQNHKYHTDEWKQNKEEKQQRQDHRDKEAMHQWWQDPKYNIDDEK